MLYLNSNSGNQNIYLTLQDAGRDYTYTHYLFKLVHRMSLEDFYFVGYVINDNPRYTKIQVATNATTTNNVLLTETGDYDYFVYAQNSSTNKDPDNAAVVALIEQGTLRVPGAGIVSLPTITLEDNVLFYGNE
jgi:hypothetical protein